MKTFVFLILLLIPVFSFAEEVTVAVAANVQFAMEKLAQTFQAKQGIQVKTSIGSSGQLSTQIQQGAPFDVFLSADMDYPAALYKSGFATTAPRIYAYGALVLWTLRNLDLSKGLAILNTDAVQKIAIANPDLAPYGREALRAMTYYKVYDQVKSKLVYGESIAQTNNFIISGAADAGFTAKSVVTAPEMKGKGTHLELDKNSYQPIAQGIVILKHGATTNSRPAQAFFDFVFSSEGKSILEKYGYSVESTQR